ncbi:MAG: hypothetical protein PHU27_12330 [Salinivirgaceae bacterium]|nr:hypothetical protein [Salinivirgaceae bacterium]
MLFVIILFLISGLLPQDVMGQCDNNLRRDAYKLLDGATYLRDMKISLAASKSKNPDKEEKPFMMNKGNRYRFVVASDPSKPGVPVIRIFDQFKDYVVSDKGTPTVAFDFICKKTQIYKISVNFQEGKDGCCIFMMSMVEH